MQYSNSKQQLNVQLDSLRSDIQWLEELVGDLRTAIPDRGVRMAEMERANMYADAVQQLEALQPENSTLRERLAREERAGKEEIASLSRQLREAIREAEATEERAKMAKTEAK